jgi:F0F1-type ATP synthase alpha subunit
MAGELIVINQNTMGVVLNVEDAYVKAIIFAADDEVQEGY